MVEPIIGLGRSKYSIPVAEQRLYVGFFSNLVQSVVHKEAAVLPKAAKTKQIWCKGLGFCQNHLKLQMHGAKQVYQCSV